MLPQYQQNIKLPIGHSCGQMVVRPRQASQLSDKCLKGILAKSKTKKLFKITHFFGLCFKWGKEGGLHLLYK